MGRIWLRAASLSLTCWRARGGKAWTEKPAASELGRALHLHYVPSLKLFCRSFNIPIENLTLKAELLADIDAERSTRAS